MPVGKNSQDLFPFKYDLFPFEGNLILFILPWAFEKSQLFYSDVENHMMLRNVRERWGKLFIQMAFELANFGLQYN